VSVDAARAFAGCPHGPLVGGEWIAARGGEELIVGTRDVGTAHALALRARSAWISAYGPLRPTLSFGGFKQSGFCRERGLPSLETCTELKSVFVDLTAPV
jgi:acyl-CoA reductase-like NAD-dependent aldehyde dehydrogenase